MRSSYGTVTAAPPRRPRGNEAKVAGAERVLHSASSPPAPGLIVSNGAPSLPSTPARHEALWKGIIGAALALSLLIVLSATAGAPWRKTQLAPEIATGSRGPTSQLYRVRGGGNGGTYPTTAGTASSAGNVVGFGQDWPAFSSVSPIKVVASNEYGELDQVSRDAYGLDMVMEPFRMTTLTVEGVEDARTPSNRFVWRLQHASHEGVTNEDVDDYWAFTGGHQATVTVDKPGRVFILSVKQYDSTDMMVAEDRIKVSCKYVRREIRKLTDADREAFFNALHIWYAVPVDVGRAMYGPEFDNYQRVVAVHNSNVDKFCYHIGNQFLTSHVAFDITVERYLQMIDPKIALPMWDYMIDSATLGEKWYNSIIFDPQWFGSATGDPDNDFMLSDSRFSNISTIYDPDSTLVGSVIDSYHNPYGLLTASNNYQDTPRLTRSSTFCGLKSHSSFATAEVFTSCFDESTSLIEWEDCMETMVHGDVHGYLGGAFNCNTDMDAFSQDHPEYSTRLLSFVLEHMAFAFWPTNAFLPSANSCDTECTRGQTESCGCTCTIDAFSISDEEVYSYMDDYMSSASSKFQGDKFVTYDAGAQYPYGFMQDGEPLSDEENLLLMRYLVKIGCEPGATGYMTTLASPLDPIFHVIHSMFEKALHIIWLSPKYNRQIAFEWESGMCSGSAYTDELPFTEASLGFGTGRTFMTNERILELMHPKNPAMTYIYEDFAAWGTSGSDTWDPFLKS